MHSSLARRLALAAVIVMSVSTARAGGFDQVDVDGDGQLFVDLAVMPSYLVRRDLNGVLVPGGVRLSTWANFASRRYGPGAFRLVVSSRHELDTAATSNEVDAFRPYLVPSQASLLAAYLEGEAFAGLQLRLGRQFHADPADFLAFDGGKLGWRPHGSSFGAELYGGVRPSVAIPTGQSSSALYELDGVQAQGGTQPVAGAVLRWSGDWRTRGEAALGFRWSWRTPGLELLSQYAVPDGYSTTAQELSASAGRDFGPVHFSGNAGYEVVLQTLMRARLGADIALDKLGLPAALSRRLAGDVLTLEYRRHRPTFALDSIFNFFSLNPYDEYAGALSMTVGERSRVDFRAFERRFSAETSDRTGGLLAGSPGREGARGGRLFGTTSFRRVQADLAAQLQTGFGGHRHLLDGGVRSPVGTWGELYGRASWASFDDVLRPGRSGRSLGFVAGGTYRLPRGASLSLLVEETLNDFTSRVPRLFAVADFSRWL
jgi:hypothetical protein